MADWNKKTLYNRIIDRWKEKDSVYTKVNNNRGVISTYFRSDEIVDTDDAGNLVGVDIYNGSGSWYSRMMATGFQGSLVSKNTPWIRYMMEQFELKGIDELDIWNQDIKEYMSDVYQRSNFYSTQPQFTHDGLTTGSPVIFGEEDILNERTMWMPQHYKNVRVYYNKFNEPEGVIVEDKTWTAKQILDTFVKKDDDEHTKGEKKLSTAVNLALRAGMLNEVFTVYKATFKITDPIWDGEGDNKFKKPTGNWKWLSVYFLELSSAEKSKQDTPLNENMGDFTQPFAIWNFDKKPWEPSSRTPAWYAIWDNLSLQQLDKNYLEDVQNANRSAFVALDTMKGRVDLSPEGEMFVTKSEYESPPKFIDRVSGLQFSKDLMELKIEALKRWFYTDQFQMFSDLALRNKQPFTATQIWQMAGEKATLLSPAIETHSTYLETIDARMIDIEVRAGRGPFNPQRMANITDIVLSNLQRPVRSVGVRPVFIGRLAQAQKVSQTLEPITSTMEVVKPLMEINPQIRFMYRWYETANDINEANDFPQKNVVPKEEWEKMVEDDNAAAAQQLQTENAVELMKASKSLGAPIDETSILSGVTE